MFWIIKNILWGRGSRHIIFYTRDGTNILTFLYTRGGTNIFLHSGGGTNIFYTQGATNVFIHVGEWGQEGDRNSGPVGT